MIPADARPVMNAPRVLRGFIVHADGTIIGPSGRVLKPYVTGDGYLSVGRREAGKKVMERVHRLVCEAFHGPAPADKPLALHRDGNRMNNVPENLYWGDHRDNVSDAFRHGTHYVAAGEEHGMSRLTWDQVEAIRSEYAAGGVSQRALAGKYGVSHFSIYSIARGRTWKGARP